MNADGSAGVAIDARIGATIPALGGLAWGVLGTGSVAAGHRRAAPGARVPPSQGASTPAAADDAVERRPCPSTAPRQPTRRAPPARHRRRRRPAADHGHRATARAPGDVQVACKRFPSAHRHRSGHDDDVSPPTATATTPVRTRSARSRPGCAVERRALGTAARDLADGSTGSPSTPPAARPRRRRSSTSPRACSAGPGASRPAPARSSLHRATVAPSTTRRRCSPKHVSAGAGGLAGAWIALAELFPATSVPTTTTRPRTCSPASAASR